MNEPAISCAEFEDRVDDLALGLVEEPRRSALNSHAASCSRCRTNLDGLVAVADRLLLVAPEIEPPPGFESRALARLGSPTTAPRPRRRAAWWVVAAVAVASWSGGLLVARAVIDPAPPAGASRSGTILTSAGLEAGSVRVVGTPTPHVLIAVPDPKAGTGYLTCELQRADGTWVRVGSWEADELASGVWASGIEADLLEAVAMRVTTTDGEVLATATLS